LTPDIFIPIFKATEVEEGNRRDRNLEFQRSKENSRLEKRSERKREDAQKLLEKQVSFCNLSYHMRH
jgi:pre-mRNA-splicing factor SYF2